MVFVKQNPFTKKPADLPDVPSPNYTPTDIKSYFQTPHDELMATVNNLVDDLNASGWVDTSKLGTEAVTREKIATGAIGTNEIDPDIMSQPTTVFGVQAKFDSIDAQLAQNTSLIRNISVDVTDPQFGAKGDGVTDDTVAIQSAIDYVYTNGGGKVRFPAKTFIVNTIYFRNKVSIEGAGVRATKIQKKTATTGNIIAFKQEDTSYIFSTKYSGFTVIGTGSTKSTTPNNIPDTTNNGFVINHYWGLDNCLFENITITDCGGTGLKIIPSPSNTVASEAMVLQQTLFNRINVKYCTAGGYIKGFVGNIQWNTCTFDQCTNNAFESAVGDNGNGPQDNTFINCAFQFSDKGFYAGSNFINKNFYGCHFEGNGNYDVHINVNAINGHLTFDGCFFVNTPINVYFQTMGGLASLNNITWKARSAAPSSDRFIQVDNISGTVYLGYNQTKISTPPTQISDSYARVRGYSDMVNQAVCFFDQIRVANGISSTGTRSRNFNGRATLGASATSYSVTFGNAEFDTNYQIYLTPEAQVSGCYVSNKLTTGFTINIVSPPASSFAVNWLLLR